METYHVDLSAMPKVTKTEDGYLRGEAIVTRTGVFTYVNADGTLRKELRHPDDVLTADSLDTLKMIPITVGHPPVLVNSSNAKDLSVGSTGENVTEDGVMVTAPLTITTDAGIKAVQGGTQELSLGYRLDLVEEKGTYDGEDYTHRQKNIRYNHLAIVDRARAGRAARLNLDGIEAAVLLSTDNSMEKEIPMQKVNVDGISYDAAPEVANHLTKQIARADKAEAECKTEKARADKAEGERDAAKDRADKAEKALQGTIAADQLHERVQARVALETKVARVANLDNASKLTDRDLMVKALQAKHEGINLDGKSDDYVAARFDAMIDGLGTASDKLTLIGGGQKAVTPGNRSDAQVEKDAYAASVDRFNSWRNPKTA